MKNQMIAVVLFLFSMVMEAVQSKDTVDLDTASSSALNIFSTQGIQEVAVVFVLIFAIGAILSRSSLGFIKRLGWSTFCFESMIKYFFYFSCLRILLQATGLRSFMVDLITLCTFTSLLYYVVYLMRAFKRNIHDYNASEEDLKSSPIAEFIQQAPVIGALYKYAGFSALTVLKSCCKRMLPDSWLDKCQLQVFKNLLRLLEKNPYIEEYTDPETGTIRQRELRAITHSKTTRTLDEYIEKEVWDIDIYSTSDDLSIFRLSQNPNEMTIWSAHLINIKAEMERLKKAFDEVINPEAGEGETDKKTKLNIMNNLYLSHCDYYRALLQKIKRDYNESWIKMYHMSHYRVRSKPWIILSHAIYFCMLIYDLNFVSTGSSIVSDSTKDNLSIVRLVSGICTVIPLASPDTPNPILAYLVATLGIFRIFDYEYGYMVFKDYGLQYYIVITILIFYFYPPLYLFP